PRRGCRSSAPCPSSTAATRSWPIAGTSTSSARTCSSPRSGRWVTGTGWSTSRRGRGGATSTGRGPSGDRRRSSSPCRSTRFSSSSARGPPSRDPEHMNAYGLIILAALLLEFALGVTADLLNLGALDPVLPAEFRGVYDADRYARSQEYTRVRTR